MMPRACLAWVVLALLLAGCGGSYKIAPVSGRVMLDGKPLANALVQFLPAEGEDKAPRPTSIGTTDAEGRYSLVLNTPQKTKGAVVGKHKVMITLGAQGSSTETTPTFHKQLPQRYNRKTELQADVPAAGREDANFDLKSN
jgi:hypothetical protein